MFSGKPSARKRRRWAVIAAIAVGSVIATLLLGNLRFFQLVHLKANDLHFLVRGKRPTSNIVVLAIDQKSLDTYHELMAFWHPYYAEDQRGVRGRRQSVPAGLRFRRRRPEMGAG